VYSRALMMMMNVIKVDKASATASYSVVNR